MKKLLIIGLILSSCSPRIVEKVRTEIVEKEVLKDTTIYVPFEKVIQKNVTLDTLSILDTKLAHSEALISEGVLTHTLEQKEAQIPVKVVYKDKIKTITDSVRIEVPVKGDTIIKEAVPKWAWYLLTLSVISVIYAGIRIYLKIKSKWLI